jgi:hypothetical protein
VVLIDLRETKLEDTPPRRGLILHHHGRPPLARGEPAPWVGPELMVRIDEELANANAAGTRGARPLSTYRDEDVTGGKAFWGAMKPVVQQRPDGEVFDTRWLVLVQEPAPR